MARARNIKPGFFKNADLVELPIEARLLFVGLWTLADRAGRLEDRPKQIKMELFPADAVDVDACLEGLKQWGFVARYEIDGKKLIQVINFKKHQNPHRDEKVSALPAQDGTYDPIPEKPDAGTVQAQCKDDADTGQIRLNPDSLIPDSSTTAPAPAPTPKVLKSKPEYTELFETAWRLYPPRPGASKVDSFKAWNARIKEGATAEAMTKGVVAYAAYVKAMGTEPQFVKQAETFFGPARHFESDWTPPASPAKSGAPPITVTSTAAERTAAEQAAQAEHAKQAVKPPAEVLARLGDLHKQLKANA